jgi:hypothetical protein
MHCSMYVYARGAVCVERAELNGAAACWCLLRSYLGVAGLVDHPLPGCSGLASIEGQQRQRRQLCPTIDHRSTVAYICARNSTPCLAGNTLIGSTR